MIATRFREVVWTGGICAAALSFYMVSQTVAAKRAELTGVERRIAATNQEIRQLRTEIDTRGGLAQIESWNARVYGLQAPGAQQFVNSAVQLVAMASPQPLPLDPAIVASHGALNQVKLDVIEDGAMNAAPAIRTVSTAPAPVAAPQPQPIAQPVLRQASYIQPRPSALVPQAASPVREVAVRKIKVTALDDSFLDGLDEGSATRTRKVKP